MPSLGVASVVPIRHSHDVRLPGNTRSDRLQAGLGVASLLMYAVGYPLAIVGRSAAGWVLVMLGGLFLIAFGVLTIRRIHRSTER